MKVGTKSLLFGVHCFWFHPLTVFIAWVELYGLPNWKECICIFIHDWGYWGCDNMDGVNEGADHPYLAARIAYKYLDNGVGWMTTENSYSAMCLYHSRRTAKVYNVTPSKLCWADKYSIRYDPEIFYLLRANGSGEIKEYRKHADEFGEITLNMSNSKWYWWSRNRMIRKVITTDKTSLYGGSVS